MFLQPVPDCLNGDLRGPLVGEHEDSGRDAAERDTFYIIFFCDLKTGSVAGSELFFVMLCKAALDNRPDGVNNIFARQVKSWRDLCLASWLWMALLIHYLPKVISKTNTSLTPNNVPASGPLGSFVCVFLLFRHFHGSESHTN